VSRLRRLAPLLVVAACFAVAFVSGCASSKRAQLEDEMNAAAHKALVEAADRGPSKPDPRLLKKGSTPSPPTLDYLIGPSDEISVTVVGEDDLSGRYRVGPDGSLSMPLVGTMKVDGMTRDEVASELRAKIEPFFERERYVAVNITEYNNNKVYVLGRVEQPGVIELTGRGTVLQALAAAGGLPVREYRSFLARCAIIRGRDELIWIDLTDLLTNGNIALNVPLRNGDVVFIPDSEDTMVFVMGQVNEPGAVLIKVQLRLTQALARAGGFTEDADLDEIYLIRNPEEGGPAKPVRVDLKRILEDADFSQNYALKSGDVIYVARTGIGDVGYYLKKIAPISSAAAAAALLSPSN